MCENDFLTTDPTVVEIFHRIIENFELLMVLEEKSEDSGSSSGEHEFLDKFHDNPFNSF